MVAVPANGKNEAAAREFLTWVLSDDAQLNGLAKNSILTTRTDLADNEYTKGNEKVLTTAAGAWPSAMCHGSSTSPTW